ncbi:protein phosphatase 2C domain-containing protein [Streptomyces sp. NPDC048415]|uniref:PP2C family serine/threonine-protein phosphatase n=1 Tax=Streptomyces sp. NPDC048415 TaxID=3154822 RepID=UPI003442E051
MSEQGEKPTGHEDDWWRQLYDDSTEDTGPAAAADSLDDRFASAAGTVGMAEQASAVPQPPAVPGQPSAVPEQRSGIPGPPSAVPGPPSAVPGPPSAVPGPPSAVPGPPSAVPEQRGGGSGEWPGATPRAPHPGRWEGDAASGAGSDVGRWEGDVPSGAGSDVGRWERDAASGAGSDAGRSARDAPPGAGFELGSLQSSGLTRQPAPWEPPPAEAPAPAAFPPGPTPPGFPVREPSSGRTDAEPPAAPAAQDAPSQQTALSVPDQPPRVDYVGSGPPTYDAEPTALPPADPDDLDDLVADTVLDGARCGTSTLRAVSVRGDSARYRGEPRRDSLLTARFGAGEQALVLVAMATGARATPGAHRAAAEACQWIGRAVGRSHARLAEDIRAARRGDLKSGLHRLTDRSLGKLRASAAEQAIEPEEYTASLRCLLLPADPECRTRVFFGVGAGGLFRLRDGEWQDIEPRVAEATGEAVVGFGSLPHETPEGDRLTMDLGITTPPSPYEPAPRPPRDPFRFRASVARPGDTLLLCTGGLAEPLRGEPELAEHLTTRWSAGEPPGLAAFLADTLVRVKGYADDRTAAAVWEA